MVNQRKRLQHLVQKEKELKSRIKIKIQKLSQNRYNQMEKKEKSK